MLTKELSRGVTRLGLALLVVVAMTACASGPKAAPSAKVVKAPSGNPLIRDIFSADVAAMVSQDTVYIYVGHDETPAGGEGYTMNDWYCYSTTDMKTLTPHGALLSVLDFAWASGNAWASQVVERDGKFYWYVSINQPSTGGMAIGVAVADSPLGPFKDAIGGPLITSDMTTFGGQPGWTWDDIDPTVLVDDDGQAYMYFGNTYCKYVKLNKDMVSVDTSGTKTGEVKDAIVAVRLPIVAGLNYTEAPWLSKHNGLYYLSYAAGWEEQLVYCTSKSPTGPWKRGGLLMAFANNSNTSHQALIDFKGKSYILYHNGILKGGSSFRRSVCVEEFSYKADGSIETIRPTR